MKTLNYLWIELETLTDIATHSKEQLMDQLEQLGEKPFRAKQIY